MHLTSFFALKTETKWLFLKSYFLKESYWVGKFALSVQYVHCVLYDAYWSIAKVNWFSKVLKSNQRKFGNQQLTGVDILLVLIQYHLKCRLWYPILSDYMEQIISWYNHNLTF